MRAADTYIAIWSQSGITYREIQESVGGWKRHPGDKLGLIGRDGAAWALLIGADEEGLRCEECGGRSRFFLVRPLERQICWWCWRESEA